MTELADRDVRLLLETESIEEHPRVYLSRVGEVFARFGAATQDSGNESYGVRLGDRRFFVKTAGEPAAGSVLGHDQRVALLQNAADLARSCSHATLPALRNVVGSPVGPMLVYDWAEGELLGVPRDRRDDPSSAYRRFRSLPVQAIVDALTLVYELHRDLAEAGWIAEDLYDGALLYDFDSGRISVIDLDHYHRGPFVNDRERLFGSTRFMAPEEFQRGGLIDQRTTVFNLGRLALVFLSDGTLDVDAFRGTTAQYAAVARACDPDRLQRFATVGELVASWKQTSSTQRVQGQRRP